MNSETNYLLREILKWQRLQALPFLKQAIEHSITTKEQKKIYELSDGKLSTNEISKKLHNEGIKASHMTVYNYWKRWYSLGLVMPSKEYSGRFEKIIDLSELNL